jgi:hypothetical protein
VNITPGIGATIYTGGSSSDLRPFLAREETRALVRACDHVTLHTAADASDPRSAALVRVTNPTARVWLAVPANYLSRMDLQKGRAKTLEEVARIARIAAEGGFEVLEFNGEGASSGATVGDWTSAPGDAAEAVRLETLGCELMEEARLHFGGALAWTSHDGVRSFKIPRRLLRFVDIHAPQHYPAMPGRVASQRELERRVAWSRGQWEALAAEGRCPADVAPGGAKWSPYLQAHGHALGAMVYGLTLAETARLWAYPGSWEPLALEALRLARTLRAATGYGPGAVEAWQTSQGLEADGIVGERTLRSLQARAPR